MNLSRFPSCFHDKRHMTIPYLQVKMAEKYEHTLGLSSGTNSAHNVMLVYNSKVFPNTTSNTSVSQLRSQTAQWATLASKFFSKPEWRSFPARFVKREAPYFEPFWKAKYLDILDFNRFWMYLVALATDTTAYREKIQWLFAFWTLYGVSRPIWKTSRCRLRKKNG